MFMRMLGARSPMSAMAAGFWRSSVLRLSRRAHRVRKHRKMRATQRCV